MLSNWRGRMVNEGGPWDWDHTRVHHRAERSRLQCVKSRRWVISNFLFAFKTSVTQLRPLLFQLRSTSCCKTSCCFPFSFPPLFLFGTEALLGIHQVSLDHLLLERLTVASSEYSSEDVLPFSLHCGSEDAKTHFHIRAVLKRVTFWRVASVLPFTNWGGWTFPRVLGAGLNGRRAVLTALTTSQRAFLLLQTLLFASTCVLPRHQASHILLQLTAQALAKATQLVGNWISTFLVLILFFVLLPLLLSNCASRPSWTVTGWARGAGRSTTCFACCPTGSSSTAVPIAVGTAADGLLIWLSRVWRGAGILSCRCCRWLWLGQWGLLWIQTQNIVTRWLSWNTNNENSTKSEWQVQRWLFNQWFSTVLTWRPPID